MTRSRTASTVLDIVVVGLMATLVYACSADTVAVRPGSATTAAPPSAATPDPPTGPAVPSGTLPGTQTTTTTSQPPESTTSGSGIRMEPPHRATWSSTIAVSPDGSLLYVANPDSGSVTAVDTTTRGALWETPVGTNPTTVATSPSGGELFVAVTGDDLVVVLDARTGTYLAEVDTHRQPHGVIVTPDGATLIVSASTDGLLDLFDTASLSPLASIEVAADPRGLAIQADGSRLYVTHLLTGDLSVVDLADWTVTTVIRTGPENNASRHVALHPDGDRAFMPLIRSRTSNADLTFETTVMPRVAVVDLLHERVITRELLGLDAVDQPVNMPSAVAFSPGGSIAYVVNAGSDDISVVDLTKGFGVGHVEVGSNPRGIVVTDDGMTAYVHNALSDDISVVDLTTLEELYRIPVTRSPLPADVLAGKLLFHGSSRTEMARDQWITCASCHLDGAIDRRTWQFEDGPRNTLPILGLTSTFPFHWSGDRVDLFDFQRTIMEIQSGTGLTDEENAHLAAFLGFEEVPPSPFPVAGPDARGEQVFTEAGCAGCHAGRSFTDGLRHDVGTADGPAEMKGPSIDTPSLLGLYATAPYLHDGSAATLHGVFASTMADDPHDLSGQHDEAAIDDLVAYLRSLPR